MKVVLQPLNSRVCGQAVVAMILGITLGESCALFGHRHGTRTKELVSVLRAKGCKTSDRLILKGKRQSFPRTCIVHMTNPLHWALLWCGTIYDPALGVNPAYPQQTKLPSYLAFSR